MAKTPVTKKAAKTVRRAPLPATDAAPARPPAPPAPQAETSLYEVLQPFKFAGIVVKPPEWVEMSADDAREYQEAGVLGTEEADADAARAAADTTEGE